MTTKARRRSVYGLLLLVSVIAVSLYFGIYILARCCGIFRKMQGDVIDHSGHRDVWIAFSGGSLSHWLFPAYKPILWFECVYLPDVFYTGTY